MKLPLLTPLLLLPSAHAWGSLGHTTIAYLAEQLIAPPTTLYMQAILQNHTDSGYLAAVATWADSYRYTANGRFSAGFHYIDAADSPPETCGVVFDRDCDEGGCIISAIANYTTRLLDPSLAPSQRAIAAKFLIHLIGDIHQPLHAEALLRGGNGINVTFAGHQTNLHAAWDTAIPERLIGGYTAAHALKWARALGAEVSGGGRYVDEVAGWLGGVVLEESEGAALGWARESNKLVCEVVVEGGWEGLEGRELGGSYYEGAVGVVERQVARAGVRLARWLDLIAGEERGEL